MRSAAVVAFLACGIACGGAGAVPTRSVQEVCPCRVVPRQYECPAPLIYPAEALKSPRGCWIGHVLAWSPDGKLLASNDQNDIVLFDTKAWEPKQRLVGHSGWVTDLAFTRDGRLLVSGSIDATLRVWQVGSCSASAVMFNTESVDKFALAPDGITLAAGSDRTRQVRIWRLGETSPRRVMDPVVAVPLAFSRDGATLVTGNEVWSGPSWSILTPLHPGSPWPLSMAFSPDGRTIATESRQGLALWSGLGDVPPRWVHRELSGIISFMAYSPDGKAIADWSGGEYEPDAPSPGPLVLWTLGPPDSERVLNPQADVTSLAFSPDGAMLAAGSDEAVTIWSATNASVAPRTLLGRQQCAR